MNPVVGQLGPVLWRVGDIVASILLIGCPAAIFTLLGFAPMTNIAQARAAGFVCIVMAGLSWASGRAMSYILTEARSALFDG